MLQDRAIFDLTGRMQTAINEMDVESHYREAFLHYYGAKNIIISSPYSCDGFLKFRDTPEVDALFNVNAINNGEYDSTNLRKARILFEFKDDLDFTDRRIVAQVLLQAIFYLKRFELDGKGGADFPSIIFIGDRNECYYLHTNKVIKYLDKNVNWNLAPSTAYQNIPELVTELVDDPDVNPLTFQLANDTFRDLLENISRLNLNTRQHIRITEHNINRIFSQFISRGILTNNNLASDLKVSIFIGSISDSDHYYLHPTINNKLIIPNNPDGIRVDAEKYRAFFNYFQGENYSLEERRVFTEIQDRLLDELQKKMTGERKATFSQ